MQKYIKVLVMSSVVIALIHAQPGNEQLMPLVPQRVQQLRGAAVQQNQQLNPALARRMRAAGLLPKMPGSES